MRKGLQSHQETNKDMVKTGESIVFSNTLRLSVDKKAPIFKIKKQTDTESNGRGFKTSSEKMFGTSYTS